MRPVTATPSTSRGMNTVPGCSNSGTRKLRPSSPPVSHDSCEASTRKADATASVIIAKKIVCTRSENSPIASASSAASGSAIASPSAIASQRAPSE